MDLRGEYNCTIPQIMRKALVKHIKRTRSYSLSKYQTYLLARLARIHTNLVP